MQFNSHKHVVSEVLHKKEMCCPK